MKTYTKHIAILLLSISFSFFSCDGDDDSSNNEDPISETPTLTSFTPTSGPKTTIVTISGTDFAETNNLQVFFNDVEAVIESSTATQIRATVPPRAYSGLVKVVSDGTELVGETFTYLISDVQVSTFAGNGTSGDTDANGTNAQFNLPKGITIDTNGNLYVADTGNHKIRKITPDGAVTTFAGSTFGDVDGAGTTAQFASPYDIVLDSQGNLYVADNRNDKIRKITPSGIVSTLAGNGTTGDVDGISEIAQFNDPRGITIDTEGNVYVAERSNHKIRKITPNGDVTTFAGNGNGSGGETDGLGTSAQFYLPEGISIDTDGNLYVSQVADDKIRKITPNGDVTSFTGNGQTGSFDGPSTSAQFNNPSGITIDNEGNLYVSETNNQKIRKITPNGDVTSLVGITNQNGFENGNSAVAQFDHPFNLVIDNNNNIIYVADSNNHSIRKITQE